MNERIKNAFIEAGIALNDENIKTINNYLALYGQSLDTITGAEINKQPTPANALNCLCFFWTRNTATGRVVYVCEDGEKGSAKGIKLNLERAEPTEALRSILNSKKVKIDFASKLCPFDCWTFEELPNNKPSTITTRAKELKSNNILYLAFFDGNRWELCGWDTLANRATPAHAFSLWGVVSHTYNLTDANQARTKATKTVILYTSNKQAQEAQRKHESRREKNQYKDPLKRYKKDNIKITLCGSYPCYGVSSINDIIIPQDERLFAVNESELNQVKEKSILKVIDKNGYIIGDKIQKLKSRAQELKRKKQADKWRETPKADKIAEIEAIKKVLISQFEKVANSKKYDFYTLHRLEDIAEVINYAEYMKNKIEDFRSAEDFAETFQRLKDKQIKLNILLTVAPSDPLAYGFSWWELSPDKSEITNERNNKDYYKTIKATGEAVKYEQ